VTQFAYRGLTGEVVQELNGAGGVTRSYAWDSTGRQLYVKSGSNVYYEITDLHGDVAALAERRRPGRDRALRPLGHPVELERDHEPCGSRLRRVVDGPDQPGLSAWACAGTTPKVGRS